MATIEYQHVDSWFDLTLRIDDLFTHYDSYIFRGQADADWKLESTLTRVLRQNYASTTARKNALSQHLNRFKENIRGRSKINLSTVQDDELWALGQHFGLNTPLLDWTKSPYVGLFFSLFGPCNSGKRALWAVVEGDIEDMNDPQSEGAVHVVSPLTNYNDRLVTQRGLFLNVPFGVDLEEWVRKAPDQGWVSMYKITFPDAIRNDALAALNNRNINYLSLFPDLHGSSLYSNYELEIEPYLVNSREKPPWDE